MKTNIETNNTWYYTISVKKWDYEKVIAFMQNNWVESFRIWDNPEKTVYLHLTLDTKSKVNSFLELWINVQNLIEKTFNSWYDRENFWII